MSDDRLIGCTYCDRAKAFETLNPIFIHWVWIPPHQSTADAMRWLEDEHGPPARIHDGTWVWVNPTRNWYHQIGVARFREENLAFEFKMRFG